MNEIEITIQSILPAEEPQGRFHVKIDKDATVNDLLKQLCKEAHVPAKPDFSLKEKGRDLPRGSTLSKCDIVSGSVLHWTNEATYAKTCRCNTFWFLAFLSLVIGVAGIAALCSVWLKSHGSKIMDYAVVFDAGSTHTSMFVYKWNAAKYEGTAVARQIGETCKAKGEGIASFENNPSEAGASLIDCLKKAETLIPNSKYSDTPVYLGATAGMRLLKLRNPAAAEAILESVRSTFSLSKFKLLNKTTSVRIISGADEGTFSWVTSNYLTNAFDVDKPWVKGPIPRFLYTSAGALDLGGASTQITFIAEEGTVIPKGYSHNVKLYGEDYIVYTHSFLCYGVVQVVNTLYATLIKANPNASSIDHVCLPEGYNKTVSSRKVFSSPCVSGFVEILDKNYTFKGTGDEAACTKLLSDSLFNKTYCPYSHCSFNGVYQPPVTGPFFAFSTYFYVASFLNLTKNSAYCEFDEFEEAVTNFCNKTWKEILEIPASEKDREDYLMFYCLEAQYIKLLLHDNFNFTEEQWSSVAFVSKVSGSEVGWTLGFVLYESDSYAAEKESRPISLVAFALLMVLFCLFIIVALGLAFTARRVGLLIGFNYSKMESYDKESLDTSEN
ncbi:ectonucleoside triphosphate diphosphohydrolase 1 [Plakobranchus ocellatus]|uniref:Ectonucleoside triphosphate diphosphohydrolase 1 n=1 Tax=Plakobranchus ocellatus TaxID=259542 RepID=A0AAV3Y0L0_9GAST|nr:ectonucleoside triphosphate diphosphohydrolase 1 [Plakobranchus ocellatus]